jgi:hypothetical protein
MMMKQYKYGEDKTIQLLKDYIDGTYGEHYVAKDIQVVDVWQSLGSLETTARDTAIKYLSRYGKKDGKNTKDLLKAMHYIILMIHAGNQPKQDQVSPADTELSSIFHVKLSDLSTLSDFSNTRPTYTYSQQVSIDPLTTDQIKPIRLEDLQPIKLEQVDLNDSYEKVTLYDTYTRTSK